MENDITKLMDTLSKSSEGILKKANAKLKNMNKEDTAFVMDQVNSVVGDDFKINNMEDVQNLANKIKDFSK